MAVPWQEATSQVVVTDTQASVAGGRDTDDDPLKELHRTFGDIAGSKRVRPEREAQQEQPAKAGGSPRLSSFGDPPNIGAAHGRQGRRAISCPPNSGLSDAAEELTGFVLHPSMDQASASGTPTRATDASDGEVKPSKSNAGQLGVSSDNVLQQPSTSVSQQEGILLPNGRRVSGTDPGRGHHHISTRAHHSRGSAEQQQSRDAAVFRSGHHAAAGSSHGQDSMLEQMTGLGGSRPCPPHGAKAICGRRARMEDAYTAVPFLMEVPVPAAHMVLEELLPPRIANHVRSQTTDSEADSGAAGSRAQPSASSTSTTSSATGAPAAAPHTEALHFFGVFDGHGGAEAALHCARTLHGHIAEALAAASSAASQRAESFGSETGGTSTAVANALDSAAAAVAAPAAADAPGPRSHPVTAPGAATGDGAESSSGSDFMDCEGLEQDNPADKLQYYSVKPETFQNAFANAFNRTDDEFGKADNAALVGTTAVVTLVGDRQLYVANCGDSRAVLCRAGVAIPLTDDHKASREDETARVEAAGGQILFWNGVRVMGVLAVSRAIGDHCLRPFVIAQPEVTILGRHPDDELLLLASDGLWDVLSNQEACSLAKRCLRRARQRGASRQTAARIAATVLTRAAVDRGSRDNVTVVVLDLSSGEDDDEDVEEGSDIDADDDKFQTVRSAGSASRPSSSHRKPSSTTVATVSEGGAAHPPAVRRPSGSAPKGLRRQLSQPPVIAAPHSQDTTDGEELASGAGAPSADDQANALRRQRSRSEPASAEGHS